MSLISPRNLLAPLQNKVHLFAIFLVGIVFLVLRCSGGSVTMHDSKSPRAKDSPLETSEAAPATHERTDIGKMFDPRAEARKLGLETTEEGKDLPSTTIQIRPRENPQREDRKVAAPSRENSGAAPKKGGNALDEIEQSLGLR